MKHLNILFFLFISYSAFSQITANGNVGSETTAYTNGAPNDQIYIWCTPDLSTYAGSLTANSPSGTGPYTFDWFYNDENTSSWVSLTSEVGMSSTLNNLPSDGYRVEIYDDMGVLVECYVTWVWNLSSDVTVTQNIQDCDATDLTGVINSGSSFTYYNPPAATSGITAATEITVCFDATHTWVSDLAFYLVGPASCGSPTILLSPNPGAIGQGSTCNSGDNVTNLCFTTQPSGNLDVCNGAPFTLTGTYSSYGPSSTPIDWSALIGCNAAQADWAVQIYDCIGADIGALTQASITFNNLETSCSAPSDITYSSGAINSPINDNSCTAQSASIFQVSEQSTPITINATNSYVWTASNGSVVFTNPTSSLNQQMTGLPTGITTFYLTAEVSYNGINCTASVDSVQFENTCCEAVADAGMDTVICPSTDMILGTPALPNMTYQWSPSTGLDNTTIAQPTLNLDNQTGAVITETYTVTVTDVINDCFISDSLEVTVVNRPSIFPDTVGCYYSHFVVGTTSYAGGVWSAADTAITFDPSPNVENPTIITSTAGTSYTVTYTDNACNNEVSAEIYFYEYPWTWLEDTLICAGTTLIVNAPNENPDPTEYVWSDGQYGPVATFTEEGYYEVTLTNACHTSSTGLTVGLQNCFIEVPNVISLSPGSQNNLWYVDAHGISEFEVVITNRWGNVVFNCKDQQGLCAWNGNSLNGTPVEEGTYFYSLNAMTEGNEEIKKHGFIQVVR